MLDKNPKSAIWPSLGVAGHSFAFYTICALLVLSLVFRGVASADAIALYGTFIAAAYLSPFFGSWLSLRLGPRLTVLLGGLLASMGVFCLSWEAARGSMGAGQVYHDLLLGLGSLALGVRTHQAKPRNFGDSPVSIWWRYMPLAMSCWYATVALGGIITGHAGRLPLLTSFVLCSALSTCVAIVYLATSFLSRPALVRPAAAVPASVAVAS